MAKTEQSTDDLLRAKKDDLERQLATLDKDNSGIRTKIDALLSQRQAIDEQLIPLKAQVRPVNEKRQQLQNEIGKIARALGGRSTSDNPA
jgi:peptidoglycan hydrolase CwlO-like protein